MRQKKIVITFFHPVFVFFFITILSITAFFPFCTYAFDTESESPWHIIADSLTYNKESSTYQAEGNVIITRDNSRISTDFMEYNPEKMNAFAKGHVVVTSEGYVSSADQMELDLETESGTLSGGSIFIQSSHLYIKGDKIEKTGEKTYTADKVSISTCDGDSPDWKISGRDLKLTIEGYGTVYHSAFWAKKIPLLYSPFFFFPVKLKRQTGFLAPALSPSSKRKGFEYFQPFFWAISENTDATFFLRHMEKRGELIGSEYRYVLSDNAKGALMYDFLTDQEIDDGTPEATEYWGYTDGGTRLNEKRYWFRMKHNQLLPLDIAMKFNADVVSDQDYLREFDDLGNGFNATKKYFRKNFGSDIEASDDAVRTSSLLFSKSWTAFSVNSSFFWNDNIVARREGTSDYTLQQLPEINLSASKQQLLKTPLYVNLESEYNYFYRADLNESYYRGHRIDAQPRLYLPYTFKNWFTIEPSIGLRETVWHVENDFGPEATDSDKKGNHDRYIYQAGLDLSTDFFKIFNLNLGSVDKIKHSVTPKIVYNYIPEVDQENYPYFDSIDRISANNTVTFSITNYFTSRSLKPAVFKTNENQNRPQYSYNQFCRFLISQTYDINEEKETDPAKWRNGESKEEFYPLEFELDITPDRYFNLDSDWKWSKYEKGITTANIKLSVHDDRGDSLGVEYRYTRDAIESLITSVSAKLTNAVSVYADREYDMILNEPIETNTGIKYNSQCWSIDILYTDKPEERKYTFTFNLLGLGSIPSKNNAKTLEDLF